MENLRKAIWIMIGVTVIALVVAYFIYGQIIPDQPGLSGQVTVSEHRSG